MGLCLSNKKIENKIKELNAREAFILKSYEKLKVKEDKFEKDFKIVNELNQLTQFDLKKAFLLKEEAVLKSIKLNEEFERQDKALNIEIEKFKKYNHDIIDFINQVKLVVPNINELPNISYLTIITKTFDKSILSTPV